jgi:EF hand domain-containing protein
VRPSSWSWRPEDQYRSCGINRTGACVSEEVRNAHARSGTHDICSHSGVWCCRCDCTGPNDAPARSVTHTIPSHGPGRGRHDYARRYDGRRYDGPRHDGWGRDGTPIMLRMMFALMDSDGDGTISLTEFQVAHERIFKAMDSNKDGRLTQEEMQAFMHGPRDRFRSSRKLGRSLPRRPTLPN